MTPWYFSYHHLLRDKYLRSCKLKNPKFEFKKQERKKREFVKKISFPIGALVTPPITPPILGRTLGLPELCRFGGGGISAPLKRTPFSADDVVIYHMAIVRISPTFSSPWKTLRHLKRIMKIFILRALIVKRQDNNTIAEIMQYILTFKTLNSFKVQLYFK